MRRAVHSEAVMRHNPRILVHEECNKKINFFCFLFASAFATGRLLWGRKKSYDQKLLRATWDSSKPYGPDLGKKPNVVQRISFHHDQVSNASRPYHSTVGEVE